MEYVNNSYDTFILSFMLLIYVYSLGHAKGFWEKYVDQETLEVKQLDSIQIIIYDAKKQIDFLQLTYCCSCLFHLESHSIKQASNNTRRIDNSKTNS